MQIKNIAMLGAVAAVLAACGGASVVEVNPNTTPKVYFGYDSAEITDEARVNLLGQSMYMKANADTNIQIAGNCDERGSTEYNLALGARRAAAAKSVIVRDGVEATRVSTISYGKERPSVVGSGEEVWSQNRNATTTVK